MKFFAIPHIEFIILGPARSPLNRWETTYPVIGLRVNGTQITICNSLRGGDDKGMRSVLPTQY